MKPRLKTRTGPAPGAPTAVPPDGSPDDFFCLRFRVNYPSVDCAFRTRFRTCPGCEDCDQGRFNLKRHGDLIAAIAPGGFRRG